MNAISQWFTNLSTREKRLVGTALGIALFYLAYVYIAEPLYQKYDGILQEKAAEKEVLAKYQTILMKRNDYLQKIAQGEALKRQIDNGLIQAVNPEIASAQLQSIVKDFARELDIAFDRITINPLKDLNGYSEVSIRIPFSCYIAELRDFMFKVESSDYLLFISDLDIRVLNTRNPEKLRVSMDVSGFIVSDVTAKTDDKKQKSDKEKNSTKTDADFESFIKDFEKADNP